MASLLGNLASYVDFDKQSLRGEQNKLMCMTRMGKLIMYSCRIVSAASIAFNPLFWK